MAILDSAELALTKAKSSGISVQSDEVESDSTLQPVNSKELHELQDRFAIIPLYTENYEYAFDGEYMIDPNSGSSAIKLSNGKVIMDGEEGRTRYHSMQFEQDLSYYGMRNAIIKKVIYTDDSYIHTYEVGNNMLDDPVYIDDQLKIKKMCLSIDMDILTSTVDSPKMTVAYVDPIVNVKYSVDMGVDHEYSGKLSELRHTIEEMDTISLVIREIYLSPDVNLDDTYMLVHSILIGVVEEKL